MFQVIKTEGKARRGTFTCAHGVVQTPVFMNVGTQGAIKGAVSAHDLREIGCQVELSNTYHLHLRPGDDVVKAMGGLHRFMRWDGPMLTDSGGFQVFSLAGLRNITEEGVTFASHIDGHKIFMGPEESMRIQSNLGSTIAMAFDECVENPATYEYAKASCERTARWAERCKKEMARLNSLEDTINPHQLLFGINQGCTFEDLRVAHMDRIAELDLDGYAIGGLAVGEPTEEMYRIIEAVEPVLKEPETKISDEEREKEQDVLIIAQVNDYVNIRSTASTDGEIVGKLYNNSVGTLVAKDGDWYQVKSGSVEGYVKAEYFKTGDEAEKIADEVGQKMATVNLF